MTDILNDLGAALDALEPGCHAYIFAPAGESLADALDGLRSQGWRFQRLLVWDKGNAGGLGAYRNNHEPILVMSKGTSRGYQGPRCHYPSILRYDPPSGRTAKPPALVRVFVEMSSQPGELVIDPYCGTNPIKWACSNLSPPRQWAAADILDEDHVGANVAKTPAKAGGLRAFMPPEGKDA